MQIDLTFKLDNFILPKDYRKSIVSFFKETLTKYNKELYDLWYTKTTLKPFCFTIYLSNPTFEEDRIILESSTLIVRIKSDITKETIEFYNVLLLRKKEHSEFKLKNNSMHLTQIRTSIIRNYYEDEVIIKFDSPLVVRYHNQSTNKETYFTPDDKNFESMLKLNIKGNLKKLNYNLDLNDFKIVPLSTKSTIIKIYNGSIKASLGTFKLIGTPELISLLNKIGLGSMRSSGFGYFRILDGKE